MGLKFIIALCRLIRWQILLYEGNIASLNAIETFLQFLLLEIEEGPSRKGNYKVDFLFLRQVPNFYSNTLFSILKQLHGKTVLAFPSDRDPNHLEALINVITDI